MKVSSEGVRCVRKSRVKETYKNEKVEELVTGIDFQVSIQGIFPVFLYLIVYKLKDSESSS